MLSLLTFAKRTRNDDRRAFDLRSPLLAVTTVFTLALLGEPSSFAGTDFRRPPTALTAHSLELPNGRVGTAYFSQLIARGGTPPYAWSLTSGSLPAGLSLMSSGVISGKPSAEADRLQLTFQVRDSGRPAQTASATAVLDVGAVIAVSLSVKAMGTTTTQPISLSATTNDRAGVIWRISPTGGWSPDGRGSPDGGLFFPSISMSGSKVTLIAPAVAGVYTVTATSVSDHSKAASATLGVTDLAGVYTYHNDLGRTGANVKEFALTPSNVNANSFGKLFSCAVDGAIYAQPLWVANLFIGETKHNAVFVATEHDGVFAFDADQSPCKQLWSATLLDAAHGANTGETTVQSAGDGFLVGYGNGDLSPETGITGTPVIDPATRTLYVVSKSVDSKKTNFYQRLHALDLRTGAEKPGSPIDITATYPGTGDGGTTVTFNPQTELQRSGLGLVNGKVIIVFASHEDRPPYYGWVLEYHYNGSAFTQTVLNVAPNVGLGGIWMSGSAPAADESGNIYLITGNGNFDANNAGPLANNDYGDSLLQLSTNLTVTQYFTPSDQLTLATYDGDFGAGGAAVLVNLPAGSPVTHLVVGGGKVGILYVLNRDALGGYGDNYAWQQLTAGGGIFSTPAAWNNYLYIGGMGAALHSYQLDPSTALFSPTSSSSLTLSTYAASPTPSVSANGTSNGIVWIIDNSNRCKINAATPSVGGPSIVEAHDATNVTNVLWSSATTSSDTAGNAVKFTVPTIANGKVYIGTRGSGDAACSLTATTGELDVYGLK